MTTNSFLARPYQERQMIVVSDEQFIAAAEEESSKKDAAKKPERVDWVDFTAQVVKKALTFNATGLMIDISVEAFKAWSKARENGVPVLPISREQAAGLTFRLGHPLDRVVYIGHPAIPNVYHTLADFHRRVFEHKVSEAILLLMSLGATSIRAEHVSGWSHDFSAKLSLPISGTNGKGGVEVGTKDKTKDSILFTATLSGMDSPAVPDGLMWYPHEPTWQMIAQGRLKHGLRNFTVSVNYSDDFGINLGVEASIANSGLDLGGKFEGHESTIWKLTGQFGSGTQAKEKAKGK
ncbi:hypothetical protein [Acidisphaera sp. S103]|uniref:hypothetical protein n=1 Tax=Acidisphaera sp. S103 TaxID=1747223 RepID=UPI001C202DE7|nr:hypothetical protein [Acidisphaera sp. S103]